MSDSKKKIDILKFSVPNVDFSQKNAINDIVFFNLSSLTVDYEVLDIDYRKNEISGKYDFKVRIEYETRNKKQ